MSTTSSPSTKPTLLVLAAGLGSRYADGNPDGKPKQIDPMGPSEEVLLEYSVFDALRAGFGKVVFIIRHDFEEDFKAQVSARFSKRIPVDFAYQELNALPAGFSVPPGRKKPWGTAHAILCAKDVVKEPFCVINADDFYGQTTYKKIAEHLRSISPGSSDFAMVGFRLDNTLSENGPVTRGICETDEKGFLAKIEERENIEMKSLSAETGKLTGAKPVSMNIWGFTPKLFEHLDRIFREFLKKSGTELKSECYIPVAVGELVKEKLATCKVLDTDSKWFGITHPNDKQTTKASLLRLVQAGEYPENLWNPGPLWEKKL